MDVKSQFIPIQSPKNVTDYESFDSYITRYAAGDWNPRSQTLPVCLKEFYNDDLVNVIPESDTVVTLNDLSSFTEYIPAPQNSESVLNLFKKSQHLTAPLGPFEEERLRVCRKFGLYDVGRRSAIDTVCAMAKDYFRCSLVSVSVVLDDREVCLALEGFPQMDEDPTMTFAIPLKEAICTHLMTRTVVGDATWIMEDVKQDWRFRNNPHVKLGGMSFIASCNIFLPTGVSSIAKSGTPVPESLPCGSLCVLDTVTGRKFTAEDEVFLNRLADIVSRELQLGHEQKRQEAATNQTAFLGEFLRASLVLPNKPQSVSDSKERKNLDTLVLPFQEAAENLRTLTSADAVVVLDLRAFNAAHAPPALGSASDSAHSIPLPTSSGSSRSGGGTSYFDGRLTNETPRRGGVFSGLAPGAGAITILGGVGYEWESIVGKSETKVAISQSLMNFYANGICEFDSSSSPSPLADILPPGTAASLACPIFDYDGKPALLLLVVSLTRYFRFESTDRQFVENVGAVAIGSLLRRRILEADRAKLAFVSQVSHELRTPLHAIFSQLELIRIVTAPPYLATIKPLLAVAEVCCASLREILDDTLTFAKMSNPTDAPLPLRKLQEVVLENLVEDVVKSCWARTRQCASIASDGNGDVVVGANGAGANVKIIMEIDEKLVGCKALVDVGGLKRVLFNLVGNALKFTVGGTIKIVVKILRPPSKSNSNSHCVGINVVDTGVGMSEEFLKEQLFIPFRQLDSFSSGAGLGISICDNIVKRMNGSLQFLSEVGVGTTALVAVPLELIIEKISTLSTSPHALPTLSLPGRLKIRLISDELNDLLDPSHFEESNSPIVTPKVAGSEWICNDLQKPISIQLPPVAIAEVSDLIGGKTVKYGEEEVLVLVVDDNIIARKILTTFLSVKGVKFVEASDGLEAVEAFRSYGPNLVWCDIQMPVMDGLEATRQMRIYEQEHDLPPAFIVALSGLSDEDGSHSSALASGQISEWLTKGGKSLRILGQGLVTLQAKAAEQAARNQRAVAFEEVAHVLRCGQIPTDAMLNALAYPIPSHISINLPSTPPSSS